MWLQTALLVSYEWLRDWQLLIGMALLIWTMHACTREIRQTLRTISKPSLADPAPVVRPERTVVGPSAETTDIVSAEGSAAAREPPAFPTRGNVIARLEALRIAVRQALAEIPSAGGSISGEGARLYRKVMSISLDDIVPTDHFDGGSLPIFHELQTALRQAKDPSTDTIDTKTAWEWLVRVNTLARKLQATSKAQAPVEYGLEGDGLTHKRILRY